MCLLAINLESASATTVMHLTGTLYMSVINSSTGSRSRLLQRSTHIDAIKECSRHKQTYTCYLQTVMLNTSSSSVCDS